MARLDKEWKSPYHLSDILSIMLICQLFSSANLSEQDRSIKFIGKLPSCSIWLLQTCLSPICLAVSLDIELELQFPVVMVHPSKLISCHQQLFWHGHIHVLWAGQQEKENDTLANSKSLRIRELRGQQQAIVNFLYLTRANQWQLPLH